NKEGCVPNDQGRTSMRATTEALARQFEGKARDALATLEKLGDTDWKVAPVIRFLASKPASYVTVAQYTMGGEWKRESAAAQDVVRHATLLVRSRNALAVPAPHRSPLIFSARMPVKCFQPSSWPRPISSSGSPWCVNTRSVAPRDGVISTVTRDSSPRVASDIHVNSNSRGRSTRR